MKSDHPYSAIFDAEYWEQNGAPHDVLAALRKEHPVYWYESERFEPVWLVTRQKDVEFVGKNPNLFLSAPRTVYHNPQGHKSPLVGLPQMDAPKHTQHRQAMQSWFTPRAIRALEDRMSDIAAKLIDEIAKDDHCEFCRAVGAQFPLKLICELLGIPKEQESAVWQMTQDIFAAADPDLARGNDAVAGVRAAMEFCAELASSRQANPTEDFASAVANAEVDGQRLSIQDVASHLLIMISAGHDTTASAISGGMLALIQNPQQLSKLKQNPALTDSAVNEMLRYVTPTTNFVRTATEKTEISGVPIAKGDDVCIHFCAANRDEEVYDDPQAFVIDRSPNKHLAFGIGPHACIGQLLARIEMQSLFRELIPRIEHMELDGNPEHARAFWVTGLKKLPVRYSIVENQDPRVRMNQ